jgi:hypothetical protein
MICFLGYALVPVPPHILKNNGNIRTKHPLPPVSYVVVVYVFILLYPNPFSIVDCSSFFAVYK